LKLKIKINDVIRAVEVLEDAPDRIIVKIRGRSYACQIDDFEGVPTCAIVEQTPEPQPPADACAAEQSTSKSVTEDAPLQACILDVNSPLPGTISSIECKVGSKVRKGDVVLYLEAMKMLNDIVAPKAGMIESFDKSPGQTVNVGDLLFRLKVTGE